MCTNLVKSKANRHPLRCYFQRSIALNLQPSLSMLEIIKVYRDALKFICLHQQRHTQSTIFRIAGHPDRDAALSD